MIEFFAMIEFFLLSRPNPIGWISLESCTFQIRVLIKGEVLDVNVKIVSGVHICQVTVEHSWRQQIKQRQKLVYLPLIGSAPFFSESP